MGRDDVDFVVGDDLPRARAEEPAPAEPPRRRRRLVVLAVVAVLAGAGITARVLSTRMSDPQAAASAPASAAASTASAPDRDSSTAADPSRAVSSPLPTPTAGLGCPQFVACSKSTAIPSALVRAVRAVFPKATAVSGQTVLLRRDNTSSAEVHARLVTFHVGRLELFIRITTPGADDDSGAVPVNTRTVIRTVPTGQYVTIEVAAQNGVVLPGYDVLQRLVADTRLLAT